MKALRLIAAAAIAAASFGAHAVGQLADVRIFDRAAGRELPVYWHDGKPYVVGKPGNEYQVTVRNPQGGDLLAVVSVDGVNVVTGQAASPQQGGYVVPAGERTSIGGWRKSLGEIAAFYFTSLGDSYAARTHRPDNVGVIGVALFERRRLRHEAPAQDNGVAKRESRESRAPSAPLGTGHGRREESQATYAQFERATREPVETIAIYYDSRENLVAQGVLPSRAARRDPDPFPTRFVPDPPRYRF